MRKSQDIPRRGEGATSRKPTRDTGMMKRQFRTDSISSSVNDDHSDGRDLDGPPGGDIVGKRSSVGTTASTSIQVAVRCRPLNAKERENKIIWKLLPELIEELEDDGVTLVGKSYPYERVFGPESTNLEVYDRQCSGIVQGALEGYNGTIFTYGQTASGKTFTLMGDPETNPGVTPRACKSVFDGVIEDAGSEWKVYASYMEIYNEVITDLLQPDPKKGIGLKIIEDKMTGISVKDCSEVSALNYKDCLDCLTAGEKRRSYSATDMNAKSSRSHTLLCLRIESKSVMKSKQEENLQKMRNCASEFLKTQRELNADRASLYLVDRESKELYIHTGDITLRFPMSQGIAGAVATTAQMINIPDAYEDPRFNPDIDKETGYTTKSILCAPIFDAAHNEVVGVVQFFNKMCGGAFDKRDEECVAEHTKLVGPLIHFAQTNSRTTIMGRLNLVDLAGSERQSRTGTTGASLKEAAHINTSLMMLARCISMLSEKNIEGKHVPFRDSKLTHLLSHSLGGNANTCIICNISPAACNRNETTSTLQFASRAKKIINKVKKNCRKDQSELVEAYETEIERLKAELQETRGSILAEPIFTGNVDETWNMIDFKLTDSFVGQLTRLQSDAQEAMDHADALVKPSATHRLVLYPLVAVNVATMGQRSEPLIVLNVSLDCTEENEGSRPTSRKVDWISEEALYSLLEWLRAARAHSTQGVMDVEDMLVVVADAATGMLYQKARLTKGDGSTDSPVGGHWQFSDGYGVGVGDDCKDASRRRSFPTTGGTGDVPMASGVNSMLERELESSQVMSPERAGRVRSEGDAKPQRRVSMSPLLEEASSLPIEASACREQDEDTKVGLHELEDCRMENTALRAELGALRNELKAAHVLRDMLLQKLVPGPGAYHGWPLPGYYTPSAPPSYKIVAPPRSMSPSRSVQQRPTSPLVGYRSLMEDESPWSGGSLPPPRVIASRTSPVRCRMDTIPSRPSGVPWTHRTTYTTASASASQQATSSNKAPPSPSTALRCVQYIHMQATEAARRAEASSGGMGYGSVNYPLTHGGAKLDSPRLNVMPQQGAGHML